MKYHNFKRGVAAFLAAMLTIGSMAFSASATEASGVSYSLSGERGENGEYVVTLTAQGGLINVGAIEIDYSAAFSGYEVEFAEKIKDAGFYWEFDEATDGTTAQIAFMSLGELSDEDAGLFAVNPSNTIAYIDATGDEAIDIATITFTFADGYSYDNVFVTGEREGSSDTAVVSDAQVILHEPNSYNIAPLAADAEIYNMLVFTADDFTLSNLVTTYNGKGQVYTVTSDVAHEWDVCVGDNADDTVINAGEYRTFIKSVTGEGYYEATEIEFDDIFVINKADVEISAPADPDAVDYVPGGYDLADLEITDWTVTSTGKVNAGTHTVNVKYAGTLDTNNNNYKFGGAAVTSADEITSTVELVVNKIAGEIPALDKTYTVTYNSNIENQWISNYVELSAGWEWHDATKVLAIGQNKDILVLYFPEDTDNYTYEGLVTEGYDTPCIEEYITVDLQKATGTAPELPEIAESKRLASAEDVLTAEDFIIDAGVWSYTDKNLTLGNNMITLTYKPADTDKYDYSELDNWDEEAEQFEIVVSVKVLKPYLTVVVPPVNPDAMTFVEEGYTYGEFELEEGWEYAEPDTAITSAGEVANVKVLYTLPEGEELDPNAGYTVEDGKVVSYVTLTVNKAPFPKEDVSFLQTATYTGEKFTITSEVSLKEITGVTAADFTLSCESDIINAGNYAIYATVNETANYLGVTEKFEVGIFTVEKATVTKDMFTVTDNEHIYNGEDKSATITVKDGVTPPTVSINDGNGSSAVGEYSIRVTGGESTNYKAYTLILDTKVIVTKEIVIIDAPANPASVDFVEGGVKASECVSIEGWSVITDASFNAGTHAITVRYNGTMDFNSYIYKFNGETVTAAPETTVEFTVNRIALPTDKITYSQEVTYTGEQFVPNKDYLTINGLTGVTVNDIDFVGDPAVNAGTYDIEVTVEETENYLASVGFKAGTLVINKADVAKTDITVTGTEFTYDGTAKAPTASAKDGMGTPAVTVNGEAIIPGTYTFIVAGDATTNYNAYSFTYENGLVINKANVAKESITVADTSYTFDGTAKAPTATIEIENAGAPAVAVTGEAINAGSYSFTVSGVETDYYNAYSFTYENALVIEKATLTKSNFMCAMPDDFDYSGAAKTYEILTKEIIGDIEYTVTLEDSNGNVLTEAVDAGYYVIYVTATESANYNAYSKTECYSFTINKVTLPADAATAQTATYEYDGTEKTVTVSANSAYNGLGEFTVAYPEGNIDAGTYDVTATFAAGKNYNGGTITLEDVLVITKKAVESIELPVIATEAIEGDVLEGAIDATWSYADSYTIAVGDNTVVITTTIDATTANNYDYTDAAADAGITITDGVEGTLVLTKSYTIVGISNDSFIKIEAAAVVGDETTGNVTITLVPTEGEEVNVEFTQDGNKIIVDGFKVEKGSYTLKIKKAKYLESVVTFAVSERGTTDLGTITLLAGDIIGGPVGNETIGDGKIDIDDFIIAIRAFDSEAAQIVKTAADVDGNGSINVTDLAYIKTNFGKSTAKDSTVAIG